MKLSSIPYFIELILKIVGIWPAFSNNYASLIISALLTFNLIFQFWDAYLVSSNLVSLMNSICATLAETMFFIKFLMLQRNRWCVANTISDMINDCNKIESSREESTIIETLRLSNLFFISTTFLYLSTGAFFVVTAAISYNTNSREFILEATYPFEIDKSPVYEIIFILQLITTFLGSLGNAFIDGLFIMMVLHAVAKIDILREEILRFSKLGRVTDDKRLMRGATKNLVDKYQEIVDFTRQIEYIFSYQLLVQVILSILEICATGFTFIALAEDKSIEHIGVTKIMKFIVIFIAGVWVTGVYCTGGDYLLNKNELLQGDLYSCLWYELRPADCRSLWVVMIRSQRPMTLSAGKFIYMTLNSFTQILKTSVSYLSVLRAVH